MLYFLVVEGWSLKHSFDIVIIDGIRRDGKVRARAKNGRGLIGGVFHLDYPSVGATETLTMAACLADGGTILSNVAQVRSFIFFSPLIRKPSESFIHLMNKLHCINNRSQR